ncbi:esterase/lipase family protein [Pedobacter chitinilyticus]|uniref:Alpha/beta hydrolase n=1 Tax=Pedobacter chitinilyticus TaxID=2233776 RepID=A0A443YJM8_9SPHI|nr:alpha/beta hydrolase [Pedobacter chitinilyticus]RWU03945.1 alpha/beta hydrolase [Pedobacter chitinilyticus]
MVNHTPGIPSSYGINSQSFFSFMEPNSLIVFVHGFGGSALGTWNNFSTMLLLDPLFVKTDILFYGYDTLKGQAGDHAAELYAFLCLAENPLASGILPADMGLAERTYNRIVIVAHSLGAILARQVLLLAYHSGVSWMDKTNLALFAPAHQGANIISLATQALPGIMNLLGIFVKFRYPILSDLDPTTPNGIIDQIRSQTEHLQNSGRGEFTKAKLVVYAKGDKVVRNIQYLGDVPAKVVPGESHIGVCKPNDIYNKPFELLKSLF